MKIQLFAVVCSVALMGEMSAQNIDVFEAKFREDYIVETTEGTFFPAYIVLNDFQKTIRSVDLALQQENQEEEMKQFKSELQEKLSYLKMIEKSGNEKSIKAAVKNIQAFLIQKMLEEKQKQDNSLTEAQKVLQFNKLWDGAIDSLFRAAWACVTSNPSGGGRSFLLPAVAEIIQFSVNKGFQAYAMWDQYNYWVRDAEYHASVFDYYMGQLKAIQGF